MTRSPAEGVQSIPRYYRLGTAVLMFWLCLSPAGLYAQTSSIPLSTLPPAPTSGTLANGVSFDVNVGSWYAPTPANTQGYVFSPAQSPQIWTFDVPVSLRFGLRGLNGSGECFRVPIGTVAEDIHPAHSWNPGTRLLCRTASSGPTTESTFTFAGPVMELSLEAIGASGWGRGVGFMEVTVDAGIDLEKTATGPDPLTLGSPISYSFLVTNTGNVDLSNVTVTDPLPGLSAILCPGSVLAGGESMTCTADYTVGQDDVDSGFVSNTATATGDPPGAVPQVSAQDSAAVPPTQLRRIALEKTASGPDPLTVGSTVDYSFLVTNTGNVSLTNVAVIDPLPGLSPVECPGTMLAGGVSMTCTATYVVTQADADAGIIDNTAMATGQPPTGPVVTADDSASVQPVTAVPAMPLMVLAILVMLLGASAAWMRRGRRRS